GGSVPSTPGADPLVAAERRDDLAGPNRLHGVLGTGAVHVDRSRRRHGARDSMEWVPPLPPTAMHPPVRCGIGVGPTAGGLPWRPVYSGRGPVPSTHSSLDELDPSPDERECPRTGRLRSPGDL